jgi:hypothetical protein
MVTFWEKPPAATCRQPISSNAAVRFINMIVLGFANNHFRSWQRVVKVIVLLVG